MVFLNVIQMTINKMIFVGICRNLFFTTIFYCFFWNAHKKSLVAPKRNLLFES